MMKMFKLNYFIYFLSLFFVHSSTSQFQEFNSAQTAKKI